MIALANKGQKSAIRMKVITEKDKYLSSFRIYVHGGRGFSGFRALDENAVLTVPFQLFTLDFGRGVQAKHDVQQ